MKTPSLPSHLLSESDLVFPAQDSTYSCYEVEGKDYFVFKYRMDFYWQKIDAKDLTPYQYARSLEGLKEVPGPKSNPILLQWMKRKALAVYGMFVGDDSMWKWCADLMQECCEVTGYSFVNGSRAKDWLGVGYEVAAPMSTFYQLPEVGENVALHTHLVVREDAQTLYGFSSVEQRTLFRTLIKVNGVGPKLALTILSCI